MKTEFAPQAQIVGKPRNRLFRLQRGPSVEIVRYPRRSRVIMGVDEFGNYDFKPLPRLRLDARSLPHLDRGTVRLFDRATEKNAFTTALRRKTTTSGVPTNKGVIRPKKFGGFGSEYERRIIGKIRKQNELKRRLLDAGINEHQLFLLMHSAYHSQTLFERLPAKKPSPKIRGFRSPHEVKIMKKQRLLNQRLASGTIYRRY